MASSTGLVDALVSPASKSEAMPQQLGMMMAQSQTSLAQAEAYYDKAVEKGKHGLADMLTTEAKILAAIIATYGDTLTEVAQGLDQAANSTKAEMAAIPQPEGFAVDEARASLGASVDAAKAEARRLGRKRATALRQAAEKATQTLEESAEQLGRKLGDVSVALDDAKAIVESSETQESSVPPAVKNASTSKKVSTGKHASLAELQQLLAAARKTTLVQDAAADKRFTAALAQASASLSASTAKIEADLVKAEKEEIQRVHERKVDAAPAHHRRHHRKKAVHAQ